MSIYDLEFDPFIVNLLPPDKRGVTTIALIQDLFTPIQQDHDALFDSYRLGSGAGAWSALITYNLGDQVVFRKSVYASTTDNNNTDPTDSDNWTLIQENFIGILERIEYNSQKIVLEFALNKWFGTNFVQPPGRSEIYIVNGEIVLAGFRIGINEAGSSSISTVGASASIGGLLPFGKEVGFTIYMPVEVYNALDPIAGNRDSIVRSFVDLYVLAGIKYEIITY